MLVSPAHFPRSIMKTPALTLLALTLVFPIAEAQQSGAPLPPVQTVPPAAPVPATPEASSPASPKAVEAPTHTVESGDNPWKIAQKYGIKLDELLKLNEIKDPKNLKIGDVLKLPAAGLRATPTTDKPQATEAAPTAPLPAESAPPAPAEGDDWELYTIQKGDNPWKIAKALKVEHQKIVALNKGLDFTKLDIGQQIKVPKKQP